MICPCRDCNNKGCGAYHDVCTEYQEFRKYRDDRRTNKLKDSEIENTLVEIARIRRNRK